jgi:hypothetical protein
MGSYLLKGYCMLGTYCDKCPAGVPLMRGRDGVVICIACREVSLRCALTRPTLCAIARAVADIVGVLYAVVQACWCVCVSRRTRFFALPFHSRVERCAAGEQLLICVWQSTLTSLRMLRVLCVCLVYVAFAVPIPRL